MADFYEEMAGVALELLAPTSAGGLGQGKIELVRTTAGPPPVNSWDPPSAPTRAVTTLSGAAKGVSKQFVGLPTENGGQIAATDLEVIVAPFAGGYEPGDVMELDDKPVTIMTFSNIPAVGIVAAVRFIVRGG